MKKEITCTQDYLSIADIVDGVIITEDARYIKILEISPINFPMKTPEEQAAILAGWRDWLRISPTKFSLKFTTQQTPTDIYTDAFVEARELEPSDKVKHASRNHCEFVSNLGSTRSIEHKFYLIFEYERNEYENVKSEEEILKSIKNTEYDIISGLEELGNMVVTFSNPTDEICKFLFRHYNRRAIRKETFDERLKRYSKDVQYINNAYGKEDYKNVYLKDLLAPRSIDTTDSNEYMLINGLYYSYMYIKRDEYPDTMSTSGWLSDLINFGYGVEVDVFVSKKDLSETLKQMRRKTRLTALKLKDREYNSADYEEVEGNMDALTYSRNRIKSNGDEPYDMNVLITVCAYSKKELYSKKQSLYQLAAMDGFGLGEFRRIEEEGFYSTEPLNRITQKAFNLSKHNVLTEVITAMYPFTTFQLNDKGGVLIGQHQSNGSLVVYNPFDSTKYANANVTIFGRSGGGKSVSTLTLTTRMRYLGIRSFILAPDKQDEFRRTCENLDGEFVDVSESANTRLNPFEIWPITSEADKLINLKTGNETSWLINKISALDKWVNMMVEGLNQEDRTRIKNAIYSMYKKKGITENNDSLYQDSNKMVMKEMPTYSDFVDALLEDELIPKYVISVFKQFTTGIYKNLNGPTNVDLNNKYIVFGMEHLSGELKAPMMFILLDYIWSKAKSDKTENKVIAIDEGSLLVNGKDPMVGDFVVEIFRMIRGYGGSAIFATQSISDLYKNDGEFGNTILSCSHSHILMGMEVSDIRFIQQSLNISQAEANMIAGFKDPKKGCALLCAGPVHLPIYVRVSKDELRMFETSVQGLREIRDENRERFK